MEDRTHGSAIMTTASAAGASGTEDTFRLLVAEALVFNPPFSILHSS